MSASDRANQTQGDPMLIADLKALPEGTQLRTTKKEIVTLTGFARACVVVRHADGGTREYRGVSLHQVADVHPLTAGQRGGLTGHTITIERTTRSAARQWMETERDWQALIGCRCVVERHDGRLGKVCAIAGASWLYDEDMESVAERTARTYGARYIPAGS